MFLENNFKNYNKLMGSQEEKEVKYVEKQVYVDVFESNLGENTGNS